MTRKDFISTLGAGAAFALTATCLGGCSKKDVLPSGLVDFTIDLTEPAFSALNNSGRYVIKNRVVIARNNEGALVAATQRCSHEGTYAIILQNNEWFCTDHDARFDLTGNGLNDNGKKGLTIYKTELAGDILRIYS